jgi:aquaporin Z
VIGAIVAALAAGFLLGHGSSPVASTASAAQVILAEALGTFALVYTVLNVATAGNSFYGLAIGFTVFAQAVAVGKVSAFRLEPSPGPKNNCSWVSTASFSFSFLRPKYR